MKGYGVIFLVAIAVVLGVVVFVTTMTGVLWYEPDTEVPVPVQEIEERDVQLEDHPIRLRIPKVQVDAHVQEVGVNTLGNMAAPNNFTDVGWYKHGVAPGFTGSAVITGHVDNALSLAGVFKHLDELEVGDDIFVDKQDGTALQFRVTEVQTYPYTQVPLKTLFSRRDLPRLNLITCGGTWLPHERSYDERLVVYAELVR
jgi:LPXTG-site transpeptidase (sortase) family protein